MTMITTSSLTVNSQNKLL